MKARHGLIVAVMLLTCARVARAQDPTAPVSQADVTVTLGWLNGEGVELDAYRNGNDWYHRSLYGGAGVGWYWTDHWKTEVDAGVSSSAEQWGYATAVVDGRTAAIYSTYTFSTRRVAVAQHYQFFRNAWFHPFVGGGLDLTWKRTDRSDEVGLPQPVRPLTYPTRTELLARPFATAGFKAYVAPRAFFRTDMRFAFDGGVNEVLLRVGVGVDF